MINEISKWAGSIVVAVIIVSLLEMLLPDSKNKKYIKTIMGIYILFTVISPIVRAVTGQDINLEELIDVNTTMAYDGNTYLQTNSSIENIYISNLKKDITAKLKQKGFEAIEINMNIKTDDNDDYGRIQKMDIILKKEKTLKESKIPKIEINIGDTGLKKELSDENTITESEKQQIKEFLQSTYEVSIEKITIKEAK